MTTEISQAAESTVIEVPERLTSLDAFRGLVMFLMAAEVLHLCRISRALPDNAVWAFLCEHQSHVPWIGCSIHDLIQPSFSFMVGVALPFSIASRRRRGQTTVRMVAHAWWRALVLVLLGIFLRSLGRTQTYFTFEDTLTQIGLGYGFLFLLGLRPVRDQWIALGLILAGYWAAFALYPLPPTGFDVTSVGVPADWPHRLSGFEAHWNKNTNLAAAFDRWWLNLFPCAEPFEFNRGGYQTLSFIPTLGTMLLGLMAGGVLRSQYSKVQRFGVLVLLGGACLAAGYAISQTGVCPLVKRIWTPTFALFSGGWCFLILAVMYLVIDVVKFRIWAFPLVVVGMNSITIYVMTWTLERFVVQSFRTHFGPDVFLRAGEIYEPLLSGSAVLITFWLTLLWMYRKKVFLRI